MNNILRRVTTLAVFGGILFGIYRFGGEYLWPTPDRNKIEVVGIIEAPEVNITSRIEGRIASLELVEGDHVRRGEIVCRIEDEDLKNQLRAAEADLMKARADLSNARLTLDRNLKLYAHHVISTKTRDDSQAAYEQALAAVANAKANVDYYRDRLKDTAIRSPISGVVVSKALEVGEWVTPGTPILTVDDLSVIWARVDLQETDLGSIYVGKPAEISLTTKPPIVTTGRVMAIGQEGQFATETDVRRGRQDIRTFYVKVRVLQDTREFKPGMTAEVSFERRNATRLSSNTDTGPGQAVR